MKDIRGINSYKNINLILLLSITFQLCILLKPLSLLSDQFVSAKGGETIRLSIVKSADDIDKKKAKDILVKSFMQAYEDVPLIELNPSFQSIGDVRRFYEHYFDEEFEHFATGRLYWIQAFIDNELVGWATFELETNQKDSAYLNLLVVSPEWQKIGIGRQLVFSIRSEELFPHIKTINLLIRKVNQSGYAFYHQLGFFDFNYERQENFVDISLLTGLTWKEPND